MDQFELFLAPLGVLALRTSKGRRYEIELKNCKSAEAVFHWLHVILHEHREGGQAKYYYSLDDEATVWKWIKKLNECAWCDPMALGAVIKGVQESLSMKPKDRQVIEHEYVSLKLV